MRVTAFIILALIGHLGPFWLFICGVVLYALWQRGYELLILAVFIDAQFGSSHTVVPYTYTLSVGGIVILTEAVKPHLSFYET